MGRSLGVFGVLAVLVCACRSDPAVHTMEPHVALQRPAVERPSVRWPDLPAPDVEICEPPRELDVLFIGNSYLLTHHVPDLVAAFGEHAGIELRTDTLAMGGSDFEYHVARDKTAERIADGSWDVVVLQSHSLDPIRNREGFLQAGTALISMVEQAGAQPVLFETWAREEGNDLYRFGRVGYTPDEMHRSVHEGYQQLAKRTGVQVINVGAAWRTALQGSPQLDLYASDSNHPGRLGSYLSAAVVFAALTDTTPVGRVEPLLDIPEHEARLAQSYAAQTVQPRC